MHLSSSCPLTLGSYFLFRELSTHGEGNGNPLQYSCWENPMDRGTWWVTVPGVTKSRIRLSTHIAGSFGNTVCFPYSFVWTCYIIRRRQWQPTPVLLPGKSQGWRSLVGCSPWGSEESDSTERLHFHFSLSCTGEENSNPLQYCCLENPKDRSLVGCRLWGRRESDTTDMT